MLPARQWTHPLIHVKGEICKIGYFYLIYILLSADTKTNWKVHRRHSVYSENIYLPLCNRKLEKYATLFLSRYAIVTSPNIIPIIRNGINQYSSVNKQQDITQITLANNCVKESIHQCKNLSSFVNYVSMLKIKHNKSVSFTPIFFLLFLT